ncbi:MAG: benzoylsuccinyl-CoA thiolase BbsA subunit [Kribbellaceae bacterium]|nr:benzoylsuccinyl-CoA thiolase BbsA subunit [Kribbellaceae bacterium]
MTSAQDGTTAGIPTPADCVAADKGTLIASRCASCGVVAYPPLRQCPTCWGDLDPQPLSNRGTLYSYSTVHVAPAGRSAPYTIGYIDLPEGARVFAHLAETNELLLAPDLPVRLHLDQVGDGFVATWVLDNPGEQAEDSDA